MKSATVSASRSWMGSRTGFLPARDCFIDCVDKLGSQTFCASVRLRGLTLNASGIDIRYRTYLRQ